MFFLISFGEAYALDELISYYPFNGNANDETGKGHTGTVTGAQLTIDRFGKANSAYSFDGSGDIIEISDAPDLHITSKITLCSWVKPNVLTPANIVWKRDDRSLVSTAYGITANDVSGEIRFNLGLTRKTRVGELACQNK